CMEVMRSRVFTQAGPKGDAARFFDAGERPTGDVQPSQTLAQAKLDKQLALRADHQRRAR
ncbi:hypothetical protein, partial [Bradyrhizobium guangdongense]|uniref:hypothetical protein n=1 Tax=Bradyrhizobium guangdongense TaxID=1325090 RepID=UPI001AECFA7E